MYLLKAGDLLEDLTSNSKYDEAEASMMISNLTSAVAYLHSHNIVHRDIKLENILVNRNDKQLFKTKSFLKQLSWLYKQIQRFSDGNKILKLGDFGLATKLNGPLTQKCGSPVYVAPESKFPSYISYLGQSIQLN